jgi:Spy/CpxP family protein refolding chaperone
MRMRFIAFVAALVIAPALAPATERPEKEEDPIAAKVFPPELVMKHQGPIGLTDRQMESIKNEIQKTQSRVLDFQFQIQKELAKLVPLLDARPVDEERVLAQADVVMSSETRIKKTHLAMLVRIKNLLTAEQQAKLEQLRETAVK